MITLQNVFDQISNRMGFITFEDVEKIKTIKPDVRLAVLIRTGKTRFPCWLHEIESHITKVENEGDYIRDICVPAFPCPVDWVGLGYRRP